MKNTLKTGLAAMMLMALVACKKDKKEDFVPNDELIIGNWTGVQMEAYVYNSSTNDTSSAIDIPGGFTASFKDNGSYLVVFLGDSTQGDYAVEGNSLTLYNQDDTSVVSITTLTESQLIIEENETNGSDAYDSRMELKR